MESKYTGQFPNYPCDRCGTMTVNIFTCQCGAELCCVCMEGHQFECNDLIDRTKCHCGADKFNAGIDAFLRKYKGETS